MLVRSNYHGDTKSIRITYPIVGDCSLQDSQLLLLVEKVPAVDRSCNFLHPGTVSILEELGCIKQHWKKYAHQCTGVESILGHDLNPTEP